ncbi:MAG: class I SAM-dependent methyltransferase [Planctomyces sp.]|nr:class I SAM-dependent methyltransferase [Planctomyces sp.]
MSTAISSVAQTSGQPASLICPACGTSSALASRAWRFVNARGETEWLRCPACDSYFMDGEYSLESEISHTQQMTWGDTEHGEQLNNFKQRMYNSILKTITQHVQPVGKSLLDVGCSYGGFMEAARAEGFDVYGFDIVPQAVQRVTKSGMRAQCCGQVCDFTLRTEPFDVISVLDANIYWPNQPEELAEIYRRLKPGGLLVMRIVDKSWMARIGAALQRVSAERGQKLLRRAVNDHRFSMPVGSFLSVLRKTGFNVVSASPRGAVHSDQTSLPVKLSFAVGIALWQTLGVFMAPGAVVVAERPLN